MPVARPGPGPRRSLERLAVEAGSLREYRSGVLAALRGVVAFDAALIHALSPRVPLETAVVVGLDPAALARSVPRWDALAVELGVLREIALRELVATDQQAFRRGTPAFARYERAVVRPFGMASLCLVHLVVRGSVQAAILLLSRRRRAFLPSELATLRSLAPVIAAGDTLHATLDGAARAPLPQRLVCRDTRLTPRQRELVELVAHGHTNAAIAAALGLSLHTIRNHLVRAFARVGAANRADLIRLAVLTPGPG